MHNILNYIKVDEQISTSGQPTKEQFKLIAQNGFDVIINLAMHNKGALKKEDKIVSKLGMIYIHIPIIWKAPQMDRLKLFLELLKTLEKENKKIFIHCIKNHRVSVFMHIYKKYVYKNEDILFVAPSDYKPNKIWKKVLEQTIEIT